jgi:ATP-independent RNA helicase DbpA
MDHLQRGSLKLDGLNTLVLDEADRMLDMGFHDDIAFVAKRARRNARPCCSPPPTRKASPAGRQFLRQPQEVKLLEQHAGRQDPPALLRGRARGAAGGRGAAARHYRPVSTLAFCNTRQQCRDLLKVLRAQGFHALALHGEMEQRERDQVLIQFANRSCSVLVATDVAARGLDIAQLEAVINVDVTPRPGGLHPPHRPHRPRRPGRLGAEPGSGARCARVDNIARGNGHRPE